MQITVHPVLAAQKAVLELPPEERRAAILNLLTPFDPMLKLMAPPGADPIAMFGFMRPDGPEAAYRDGLTRLEAANAEQTCRTALARAASAIAATGVRRWQAGRRTGLRRVCHGLPRGAVLPPQDRKNGGGGHAGPLGRDPAGGRVLLNRHAKARNSAEAECGQDQARLRPPFFHLRLVDNSSRIGINYYSALRGNARWQA